MADEFLTTYYRDLDGDGYGQAEQVELSCLPSAGFVSFNGDCDDSDALLSPDTTRYRDRDGDGFGDESQSIQSCDEVEGYALEPGDCDDNDPVRNPDLEWYQDLDGDGFGGETSALSCEDLPGYTLKDGDCNDDALDIYPGAPVQCERIDANCDGIIDLVDSDGDGLAGCEGDCRDDDPSILPGADEVCDEVDNDCDGLIDDEDNLGLSAVTSTYYTDGDLDGYGSGIGIERCAASAGLVLSDGDCDDSDSASLQPSGMWMQMAMDKVMPAAHSSPVFCHQVLLPLQVTAMIAMVRSISEHPSSAITSIMIATAWWTLTILTSLWTM